MIFDLHTHTIYSDGTMTPKTVIDRARSLNIGVSVTDHNTAKGSLMAYNEAEKTGTPYICGVELGTSEGKELLFYFYEPENLERFFIKEIEPFRTSRMTRVSKPMSTYIQSGLKEEYGVSLVSFPHPYAPLYKNMNHMPELTAEMLNFCDAVEASNGHAKKRSNRLSAELALVTGKPVTAGSDAHVPEYVGASVINFSKDITENTLAGVATLKKQYNFKTMMHIGAKHFRYSFIDNSRKAV